MFKILALVAALGGVHPMTSNDTFDTKEACEAVRTGGADNVKSEAGLKAALQSQGIQVDDIKSTCVSVKDLEDYEKAQDKKNEI